MHIKRISIERWRHFESVEFVLPEGAPMICLVGGNGTGKSQVLELIAACCQRVGLSQGFEVQRGNPFAENASFEICFHLKTNVIPKIDEAEFFPEGACRNNHMRWDRTLLVRKRPNVQEEILAGGVPEDLAQTFAKTVVQKVQESASIHYLSLDADRAYPKIQVESHQLTEAFDRDWVKTNKESSFRITRNLYSEWFKYLIGRENQENNRHIQAIREARNAGGPEPAFIDQFEKYKDSVQKVLPHLLFVGIDPQTRQIRFNSTGTPLTFDQLSGGEREIAFLVGQIERFRLRKGLLLVDEPELHLNYDLLRAWIGFLKDSVESGQIWLATHSLEVVEVAGQEATMVLQRDNKTRKVTGADPLSQLPVMATLSRSIGSPAFSISNLAFVLIEGEEEIGERERFRRLCDIPAHVRFLEGGSCKEVLRRMDGIGALAAASHQTLRIGGVVDKDWRTKAERDELRRSGVFVLDVHEVENFFLHPATLRDVITVNGGDPAGVESLIIEAADKRAGTWIFDAARTDRRFRNFPEPSRAVRELVHKLEWKDFQSLEACCTSIAAAHGELDEKQTELLRKHVEVWAQVFEKKRLAGDIWKDCEGKEVFHSLIPSLGFSDADTAERAITAAWQRTPALVPKELMDLREYIRSL